MLRVLASCGLGSVLIGCGSDMSAIDSDHARWLAEGEAISVGLSPLPSRAGRPVGDLDAAALAGPEDFVRLALARNPMLRAAEAKVRRLGERVPQARSLDDPMLTVAQVGEMAETAAGRVATMTSLSQKLPLGSKLDARGRIAEQEAAEARADLERARVKLAGDVRRAYWSHALAVWTIGTTEQSRALLEQVRDVADAQYRSGARAQQDVLRASAELGGVDAELARLAQRRDTAAAMLRRLLDAPPEFVMPSPAPPEVDTTAADREGSLARADRTNPALHALAERMAQFEARQRLAELNRWPDMTLSVSYNLVDDAGLAMSADGHDQWWIGMGFNLPIWRERLDAAEREAMFGRLEAASALAAERDRVAFDVDDSVLRLDSQQEVLRLLRTRVIPDARGAVEASANDYRTGTGDFLVLLDNWRRLFAQQVLEHQVAAGIAMARADLAEAIGEATPPEDQAEPVTPAEPTPPSPEGDAP